ncbi:MAG TPA: hypothetical protein V6C96_01970, partial [Vampirovibrionales bacterium]
DSPLQKVKSSLQLKSLNNLIFPINAKFSKEASLIFSPQQNKEKTSIEISHELTMSETKKQRIKALGVAKKNKEVKLNAKLLIEPVSEFFSIEDGFVSEGLTQLKFSAKGFPYRFSYRLESFPHIDLKTFNFKPVGEGLLKGWVEAEDVDVSEKKSFWNNLKFSLKTPANHKDIKIGPFELSSLETYMESEDGAGRASLVVEDGKVRNLPFKKLNAAFNLDKNILNLIGLSLSAAEGDVVISGLLDLVTTKGSFKGKAANLNVGTLGNGLTSLKGLAGRGDFEFNVEGELAGLMNLERPVLGSGKFSIKDGNTSAIFNLQKKLNLANLIFNGPLALNLNSVLEAFSPTDRGYYKLLSGSWSIRDQKILIPNAIYRGVNELNLNAAGIYDRKTALVDFNFFGSIPRVPIRVSTGSTISNPVSQLNVANVLGHVPVLDTVFNTKPRFFQFKMKGPSANQQELNTSASNSFRWLADPNLNAIPQAEMPSIN